MSDLPCTQMWRDVDAELAVVPPAGARVLVVFHAGEELFRVLEAGAAAVEALPAGPGAAALLALKRAAVEALPPQSVRSLLGITDFGRRIWFYHYVRPRLDAASRRFWDAREEVLRLGLLGQGDDERRISGLRPALSAVVPATLREELDLPDRAARAEAARRWLRRPTVRALGLVGAARLGIAPGALRERVHGVMAAARLRDNPFAQWALDGVWANPEACPPWLEAAALKRAQAGLGRLEGAATQALLREEGGEKRLLGEGGGGPREVDLALLGPLAPSASLLARLRPGGRVVWWGPTRAPAGVEELSGETEALAARDRSGRYGPPHVGRLDARTAGG